MGAAIELRGDFNGEDLQGLARASRDAAQVRRLLALAVILDGGKRTETARIGGVGLQIIRGLGGTVQRRRSGRADRRKAPGKAPTLTAAQRLALARGWRPVPGHAATG
jgi:hypothetical protein